MRYEKDQGEGKAKVAEAEETYLCKISVSTYLFFFNPHEERKVKAGPTGEFKVALEVKSVSWFPSAP